MSIGSNLYTILSADSSVTSKLTSWVLSSVTYYAIFDLRLVPANINTDSGLKDLTVQDTTLNFYRNGIIDGGVAWTETTYLLNCRAYTQDDAEALQTACYNTLNRVQSADGQKSYVCRLLETLTPFDSADNYNAIIEIVVKAK